MIKEESMFDFFYTVMRGFIVSLALAFLGLLLFKVISIHEMVALLIITILIIIFYIIGVIWELLV